MPAGQRCSACREQGHNRVTCEVARQQREDELTSLRRQLAKAWRLVGQLMSSTDRAERRARRAEREAGDARQEVGRAWAAASESRDETYSAAAEAAAARDHAQWLSAELDERDAQLAALRETFERIEEQLDWHLYQLEWARTELAQAHEEGAELGLRAETAEAQVRGYQAAYDELRRERDELRDALGRVRS
jgi:chromosome segregation ATPase